MKLAAVLVVALLGIEPAMACSGYPVRHHQINADVVVAGKVTQGGGSIEQILATRRVLKGAERAAYRIVWPRVGIDDECAFLYPVARDRGVFFLKRREDGRYDVLWAQKRWKMVY